ncbi:MAG: type III pantothenate kinase [Cyclobacteriaceae bacterium]|nr:type III pantothenate kinase [Cyclobacteriaceae bacterium]
MNAVIDIGNTNVKIGVFSKGSLLKVSIIEVNELVFFLQEHNIKNILVGNVTDESIIKKIKDLKIDLKVLTVKTPMPVSTTYATPELLGTDRLASCVGARKYAKGNLLVIDAGTCITYDMLTAKNVHVGGIISPGLNMRLEAMHTLTAHLPLVSSKKVSVIGNSTEKCMQSGASNGSLAEMKGLILSFQKKYQDLSIIIGGGDAVFFGNNLELNTFVVSNLAVEGLHAIFKYNE